ncbi:BolA family transcriptional regulator [Sulfidibacter corallicola]|uniref:BolA family transcriptional regulator n=1 Tax=Sulfidibacter corallicola TaxID=2818388 RepID=A0A8A4TDX0_SULCO|nr:BolA/IbaG family iron-sulfur metabolism protein [Sulfidibacter corallicola]QTD47760.1 BolA family transcriptional regulator [Sulfidibacter corallicola]
MTLKETVLTRLKETFPDAKMVLTDTTGTNDHWHLEIASDTFKGMSRVKQHQAIYKPLRDLIDSNQVHALKITTFTAENWPHG